MQPSTILSALALIIGTIHAPAARSTPAPEIHERSSADGEDAARSGVPHANQTQVIPPERPVVVERPPQAIAEGGERLEPPGLDEDLLSRVVPSGTGLLLMITDASEETGIDPYSYSVLGTWGTAFWAVTATSADFRAALSYAYRIQPARIHLPDDLPVRWRIQARIPNRPSDAAKSMLQDALEAAVGYRVERRKETVAVYELVSVDAGGAPELSDASVGPSELAIQKNSVVAVSVEPALIAMSLEQLLDVVVLDTTESRRRHSLAIRIDAADAEIPKDRLIAKVRESLRAQARLDLVASVASIEVLILSRLDRSKAR